MSSIPFVAVGNDDIDKMEELVAKNPIWLNEFGDRIEEYYAPRIHEMDRFEQIVADMLALIDRMGVRFEMHAFLFGDAIPAFADDLYKLKMKTENLQRKYLKLRDERNGS